MTQEHLDLFERYLDGKASSSEAAELLTSMKKDPAIAKDFEAVAAMHTAADEDLAAITLPAHLYESVLTEAYATGALSTAAATTATSTIATVATSTGTTLLSLLLTVATVAVITVWTAFDVSTAHDTAEQQATLPHSANTLPVEETGSVRSSGETTTIPNVPVRETLGRNTIRTTPVVTDQTQSRIRSSAEAPMASTYSESAPPVQSQEADENVMIASLDLMSAKPIKTTRTSQSLAVDGPHQPIAWQQSPYAEVEPLPPITLRILQRPLSGFSYDAGTTESAFGSLSFEAEVEIASAHHVGVGLHRDLFPLQIVQTDGSTVMQPYLTWYGAHYRWTPEIDLPLNARAFMHLGVGGSSSGIAVQPAVGIVIPVSQLRFGVGADMVGLAFQNNTTWGTAFSPALRIELGYQW